ncbi:hypothetical protein [Paeniglutamicibacter sp. NPDC091659]|uniref:hypothetical protein n=1 Tax=Paeniglutamicibacter sp. NPDC091659 TaxID=3364389 RepID=UPI003812388B
MLYVRYKRKAGNTQVNKGPAGFWCGVIGILMLTACSGSNQDAFSVDSLSKALNEEPTQTVTLASAFAEAGDFSRVVVGCPFLEPEDIKDSLGFNWPGARDLPLDSESKGELIFATDSEVVGVSVFSRTEVNFCESPESGGSVISAQTPISFTKEANTDGSNSWTAQLSK